MSRKTKKEKVVTDPKADPSYKDYQHMTQHELYLAKPEMVLGSPHMQEAKHLIFNYVTGDIGLETVQVVPAIIHLFLEVLLNASDNVMKSRRAGIDPKRIEVDLDYGQITVKNYGRRIPIERHPGIDNSWIPEVIYGMYNTGSGYDTDEHDAGRFGLGAKLCNTYSSVFEIDIHSKGQQYTQRWENNMFDRSDSVINDSAEEDSVCVTYLLDFSRFGLTEYTDDMLTVMAGKVILTSMACKIPVVLNGQEYYYPNLEQFASLLYDTSESLYHKEQDGDTTFELLLTPTPGSNTTIAQVNNISTIKGPHITSPVNRAFSKIVAEINKSIKDDEKKLKLVSIDSDILPNVSLIINYWNRKAEVIGQHKDELDKTSDFKLTYTKGEIDTLRNWSLVQDIRDRIKEYINSLLKKGEKTTKSKDVGRHIKNYNYCNWGGTSDRKKWEQTCIYFCEGKTASLYIEKMKSILKATNWLSYYSVKGKFPNCFDNPGALVDNDEFNDIKTILNLREGVDYTEVDDHGEYTNLYTLRYANIIFLADADVDGSHINGLLALLFWERYRSLFELGIIRIFRTAQLRVKHGAKTHCFFSEDEYTEWQRKTGIKTRPKYFKGLGSSTKADVSLDLDINNEVTLVLDEESEDSMIKAFDPKQPNERKKIILETIPSHLVYNMRELTLTNFVYNDLINYWLADIVRSIPAMDSLKEVQRKIIWYALHKWKYESTPTAECRVEVFGNECSGKTYYKHGSTSLCDAVVKLAREYTGSRNNAPIFVGIGSFGNRVEKINPQFRYISVILQPWIKYCFKQIDERLLTPRIDEGIEVEPQLLLPVVPLIFNGAKGMAVGWSTRMESYNPLDVVDWFLDKLEGKKHGLLIPWYKWYTGEIVQNGTVVTIKGVVNKTGETKTYDTYTITELPPEVKTKTYMMETLQYMKDNRKKQLEHNRKKNGDNNEEIKDTREVTSFNSHSADNTVYFEVNVPKGKITADTDIHKYFDLVYTQSLSNYVMLGLDGIPHRYGNINGYLESFYEFRLPYYEKRKELIISDYTKELTELGYKQKLFAILQEHNINLLKYDKVKVHKLLEQEGIPLKVLDMKISKLSDKNIDKILKRIAVLNGLVEDMENTLAEQLWYDDLVELRKAFEEHLLLEQQ